MKRILFMLALTLLSSASMAEIYKWVDKDGTMHFSDQPQPGASTVNLPEQAIKEPVSASTMAPASSNTATPAPNATAVASNAQPVKHEYTTLTIVEPGDQGTVRDNNGTVLIHVKVVPLLLPDDKFQVLLDGKPFGPTQTQTPLQISGVDRGEHKIAVEIQDKEGKVLRSSESITIHLHKAIAPMKGIIIR